MCDDQTPGPPPCYFRDRRFPVAVAWKTEYRVGPGQQIRVLVCPPRDRTRPRGGDDPSGRIALVAVPGVILPSLVSLIPSLPFFGCVVGWVCWMMWHH